MDEGNIIIDIFNKYALIMLNNRLALNKCIGYNDSTIYLTWMLTKMLIKKGVKVWTDFL